MLLFAIIFNKWDYKTVYYLIKSLDKIIKSIDKCVIMCVIFFYKVYASLHLIIMKCRVGKVTYRHFSSSCNSEAERGWKISEMRVTTWPKIREPAQQRKKYIPEWERSQQEGGTEILWVVYNKKKRYDIL